MILEGDERRRNGGFLTCVATVPKLQRSTDLGERRINRTYFNKITFAHKLFYFIYFWHKYEKDVIYFTLRSDQKIHHFFHFGEFFNVSKTTKWKQKENFFKKQRVATD